MTDIYNLSPAAVTIDSASPAAVTVTVVNGTQVPLSADEFAAIRSAATPSADNVFATMDDANLRVVAIKSGNYPLTNADAVVVFTATATATLPAATGSGRTYRIICRAGTLTIDADGSETIKGAETAVLSAGEDLVLTDTATGVWE